MKKIRIAAITTAVLLATVAGASAGQGSGNADKERYRCKAKGADVEMQARYESRGVTPQSARKKFRVELEAGASAGLAGGDELWISVDGANVGTLLLEASRNGDVDGETRFDSRAKGGDAKPFPANFPAVATGSEVTLMRGEAAVLGCVFE